MEISKFKLFAKSTRYWAIWTAPTIITFIGLIYVSIKISVFSITPFFFNLKKLSICSLWISNSLLNDFPGSYI